MGIAYLEPVGNFEIDLVDALHSVVEGLDCLAGLQIGLIDAKEKAFQSVSRSGRRRGGRVDGGRMNRWRLHLPAWRDTRTSPCPP